MLKDYLQRKNGMNQYFENLKEDFLKYDAIVLFGAGMGGLAVMEWLKENAPTAYGHVHYMLDNNPKKWDTELLGVPVVKPDEGTLQGIELLAITCGEGDVISEQLISLGLPKKTKVIIPDISVIDKDGGDFSYIWNHISEYEQLYAMLGDEKSKQVLRNLLNFKISHNMALIEEIYDPFERQYFDEGLIRYDESDVFLDCGSYDGETIEYYKKWSENKFSKVYAVEADEINCEILKKRYGDDPQIQLVQCAIWNEKTILRFDNVGSGSGNVSDDGAVDVNADTIDNVVGNGKCDFIKMDIEGAEYNALMGAVKTIEKNRPTLMISVYHKKEDYLRIPFLIKSMCPDYRLFFRHYRKMSIQETICYGMI